MSVAIMNSLAEILALVTVLSGAVCMVTWSLLKTRGSMLAVQLGICVSFGLHYTLLGAETAAVGNAIGALQILLSLFFSRAGGFRWICYAPIPLMLVLGVSTWGGPSSLFATVGTIVLALGRAQLDERRLRTLVVAGTGFWLVHDILVWSPVAIVDAISLGVGCLTLLRMRTTTARVPIVDGKGRNKPSPVPARRLQSASSSASSWG